MRLDRFLCQARLFKRRAEAQRQIAAGHVLLNGACTKAAHGVRTGDRLFIRYPRLELDLEVVATPPGQVSKARAAELVRILKQTRADTP